MQFKPLAFLALLLTVTLTACQAIDMRADTAPARPKIALFGEQTTHSLHRTNDPEYPHFLGQLLDKDFKVDESKPHPMGGGFLYGNSAHYQIGNFAHPQGTVLDHNQTNPNSTLSGNELKLAEAFQPNLVIFGPFGDHEALSKVDMDHFAPDMRKILDKISSFKSKPDIYIALPIPRFGKDEDATYRRIRDDSLKVAKERNLPTIDCWKEFIDKPEYFNDATHLSIPGRKHMADIIFATIKSWEAKKSR